MTADDLLVRNTTYRLFVELQRAPRLDEVAAAAGVDRAEAARSWRRLHDAHALVLTPDGTAIRMANPFAAEPTRFRVESGGASWWANCAWDAFGICAALHDDGHIETACADCGDQIAVDVTGGRPSDDTLVFHCLVPAAHWWDDIGFT